MANKIRSIELENGVIATFRPNGMIELAEGANNVVIIHTTDLESIRDTAKKNGRAEAGNGAIQPEKEKV